MQIINNILEVNYYGRKKIFTRENIIPHFNRLQDEERQEQIVCDAMAELGYSDLIITGKLKNSTNPKAEASLEEWNTLYSTVINYVSYGFSLPLSKFTEAFKCELKKSSDPNKKVNNIIAFIKEHKNILTSMWLDTDYSNTLENFESIPEMTSYFTRVVNGAKILRKNTPNKDQISL